jgi:hypothetical protein
MKRLGIVAAFAAVALFAAQAGAAQNNPLSSARPGSAGKQGPAVGNSEPPGDPVNLTIDDGGQEDCVGLTAGGQFFWLNRFTPVEYPVGLTSIQTLWDTAVIGCNIPLGASFDLFTYRDNDNNPANGATNVSSHVGQTVTVLNAFQTTSFPAVTFAAGPGDILIGAVNRTNMAAAGQFPASIDQTATQVRSWVGFAGNPPVPPPVPFGTFGTIDSFGLPGNWMMRGAGTVTPVELQDFSIQ